MSTNGWGGAGILRWVYHVLEEMDIPTRNLRNGLWLEIRTVEWEWKRTCGTVTSTHALGWTERTCKMRERQRTKP